MKLFNRSTATRCIVQNCKQQATHRVLTTCSNGHMNWTLMCESDAVIARNGFMGCSECDMLNLSTVELIEEL